jgi:hypothetical protein
MPSSVPRYVAFLGRALEASIILSAAENETNCKTKQNAPACVVANLSRERDKWEEAIVSPSRFFIAVFIVTTLRQMNVLNVVW